MNYEYVYNKKYYVCFWFFDLIVFYDINELKVEECVLKGNNFYFDGIISLEWIDDFRVVIEFIDKVFFII